MKTFITKSATVYFIILLLLSCDSFVDIKPDYALDAENYFNSPSDYDKALIGAYQLLHSSYLSLFIGEIASNNSISGGESVTDSQGLHQIDAMTHGGVNAELSSLFRYMYSGITRCNFIFEFKNRINFVGKDNVLAEAAFLRAYYYFELVKFFGDVPLVVDKRLPASEVPATPRTPVAVVYGQIEKDLQFAASILNWTNPVKGKVTKGAALALLGKAYLYQNKFDLAANTLDQIINQGGYSLFQDYATIFRVVNEGNSETVFDIEYGASPGGDFGCFVCTSGFIAVGFQGVRGYKGPTYSSGFSYNLPTKNLVDEFEANDPRLKGSVLDIEAFKTANPTVTYTIGLGGHTGYYNNKYIKRADEIGPNDNNLTSPVNHKVIRYADVLLMAAEAHNRKPSPNDAQAILYLNQVRSRVSVAMPSVNVTGSALTAAIYHERRVEFAGEGLHFFDLVRTGRAAAQITGFQTGKNELFPIPQAEIDLAGAGWKQNNGY